MLELDLVIILSGGLDSDGLPHPWVLNRLDYAADQFNTNTRYFLVTSRGTPHKAPPLDPNAFPIDEATAGARYLCRTKGVPAESILLDRWSMDTVGNAYFALTSHCQPRGFTRVAVVTSQFHMDRSRAIFDHMRIALRMEDVSIRYFAVADVGMTDEMLFARAAREGESLALLQSEVLPNIKTPEDVHRWIFEEHKAYAFADDGLCVDPKLDRALPDQARATY